MIQHSMCLDEIAVMEPRFPIFISITPQIIAESKKFVSISSIMPCNDSFNPITGGLSGLL